MSNENIDGRRRAEVAFDTAPGGRGSVRRLRDRGIVALGLTFWGLRPIVSVTRRGRIGARHALTGFGLSALSGIQLVIEQIRTGDIPDDFILFALASCSSPSASSSSPAT
jgi:hypothetical protein